MRTLLYLALVFGLLFVQETDCCFQVNNFKSSDCPITTVKSALKWAHHFLLFLDLPTFILFTLLRNQMRGKSKMLCRRTQSSVPTRLLKGLESIPLEALLNLRTPVSDFPPWMKQREPEVSTKDKSPWILHRPVWPTFSSWFLSTREKIHSHLCRKPILFNGMYCTLFIQTQPQDIRYSARWNPACMLHNWWGTEDSSKNVFLVLLLTKSSELHALDRNS